MLPLHDYKRAMILSHLLFQIYYSNFFLSYGDYHDNQTPKNHNITQ